ncbi:hypothetical protein MPL1_12396 [Methylophaga lonarensis MPL]|uniref:DUF218 domain-containing protein n=1 Tax=Methylophaga lonarensis MPL TaxID=1286106 RepID=M7NXY2_9GAMM|nr:ElyC/SanA/YdcF family protein [Methylophaga lonarensis]EMR12066.1 hypothetical protein MPL1_12396 [Methylophaga lonarensis MPL]
MFFRKHSLWLPRWYVVLALSALIVFSLLYTVKHTARWLAVSKPLPEAQLLVVEGWLGELLLLEALEEFRSGHYQKMITTGGPELSRYRPEYASYAEQAAAFLLNQGVDETQITALPAPASAQNRTYLSAVILRNWLDDQAFDSTTINIFTADVHAMRTRRLFEMALAGKHQLGIIAAKPEGFSLSAWWQTSEGAKTVLGEVVGNLWVSCCFKPGEPGSHYEMWAVEPSRNID